MPQEIKSQEKEERSSYVSIWVTPTLARQFEAAKDNQTLKETIIKNFLESERNWLSNEIKETDEATIRYTASLIGIKEAFKLKNEKYVESLEEMFSETTTILNKLKDRVTSDTDLSSAKIQRVSLEVQKLKERVESIDFTKFYSLVSLIDKLNSMSKEDIENLKIILNRL